MDMRVTCEIYQNDVFKEVNRLTNYIGSRSENDGENAYMRISTTNSDKELLDSYWRDACSIVTDMLEKRAIKVDADNDSSSPSYEAIIMVHDLKSSILQKDIIQDSLRNFFINYIAGRWFSNIGSPNSVVCLTQADTCLYDARWKIYPRTFVRKQNPF